MDRLDVKLHLQTHSRTLEAISQMLETNKKLGQWNMIVGTAFSFEKVKDYKDII